MPDYSSTDANFPASLADELPVTLSHDDATDRDAAEPEQVAGAHAQRLANEVRAVQSYVQGVTGLECTDGGGLDVDYSAGRIRYGNGAPIDVAADTLTVADDDTSYVESSNAGVVSSNTTGFSAGQFSMATVVAESGDITSITDDRTAYQLMHAGILEVEANTAGVGSPNILTAVEVHKVLTNEGATAKNYHTLPAAAAGLNFTFIVADADGLRITAAAGDTIRLDTDVSIAAGYAEATAIGAAVNLVAINETEWIATCIVGTWTVETV